MDLNQSIDLLAQAIQDKIQLIQFLDIDYQRMARDLDDQTAASMIANIEGHETQLREWQRKLNILSRRKASFVGG